MKAAENWSACDAMSARKRVAGRSWHRQRCRLGNPRTETRVGAAVIVMRHRRTQNLSQMALGHYQMLEQLGAGGMGEVFKARDTRLNRIVAIKILPAARVADPD
jgi:serine/threonine protein kinase